MHVRQTHAIGDGSCGEVTGQVWGRQGTPLVMEAGDMLLGGAYGTTCRMLSNMPRWRNFPRYEMPSGS